MDAAQRQQALDAARAGDAAQLGRLLDSYRPYVRAVARAVWDRRVGARLDESDLIQDALAQAARGFPDFRGGSVPEFAAWLRRVTLRTAARTVRTLVTAGKRDPGLEARLESLEQLSDSSSLDPARQAARQEEAVRVAEAVAALPADMQEVVLGRHVDGLTHAEVARGLGRSEGAVRMLYVRALRLLRRQLCGADHD